MYKFSEDWFSHNISLFEQFLGDLKGEPCRLLEIGSHEGRSAIWLAENIAIHPASTIETIDIVEHPNLRHNLEVAGWSNKIKPLRGASVQMLRSLPFDAYDFAYVDGSHAGLNVLE